MRPAWRVWAYERLKARAELLALIPAELIFAGGSLTMPPGQCPFMVIRVDDAVPEPHSGLGTTRMALWVHDDPGSYLRIEQVLNEARTALVGSDAFVGQVADTPGAVAVVWQGESGDLANPDYGTILRFASYDLKGRDGDA